MSDLIKMQFELVRTNLFKTIEEASEEILDVQPKGYNNTYGQIYAMKRFLQ